MAVWNWSRTATNNSTSDTSMNWSEGIAPSILNDNARALMARVAEWRDDTSGSLTTAGTSTVYTLTTNEVLATPTPTTGQLIAFAPHATNGAAPTLAVDGGSNYALQQSPGVAVATGALIQGVPYTAMFNGTAWIMRDVAAGVFSGTTTFGGVATFNSTAVFNGAVALNATETLTNAAINETRATIASAATVNIGAAAANYLQVTGVTTITAFDTVQAGTRRMLEFAGVLTLTHNATSLILPGALSIMTAAGDVAIMMSEGAGNWRCANYMRAANQPYPALGTTTQYLLSGTGATYTTPAGVRAIVVQMIGGGGGGGALITNNGSTGGTTTFNSITAVGGSGGVNGGAAGRLGGLGGTGGTGSASLRLPGSTGGAGAGSGTPAGGNGAPGIFGQGAGQGGPSGGTQSGTIGAANTGAGGGAASGSSTGGGGGGSGEYVEIVIAAPAATYTYTVGTAGAGGIAGTQAGSAGGTGLIIVREYY